MGCRICFYDLNSRHSISDRDLKMHRLIQLLQWHVPCQLRKGQTLRGSRIGFAVAVAIALAVPARLPAQGMQAAELKMGGIIGTVTDINGDPIPNATVLLKRTDSNDSRAVVTPENGFFEFHDLQPGVSYEISVSAKDFADWTLPSIALEPGQAKIVTDIQLRIATALTQVQVTYDPVQVATEQLKVEEKQRVFGIIPNFYVSYETDPAPLTSKMKFALALKVATDPATAIGVGIVSAARQAGDSLNYGQGWDAYGQRVGATAADGFTDIMIGGAILPSLLHQDPRYFYQGTGTTSSRIRHAVFSAFVTRGDDGKSEPNYSTMGGDLASAAISNLYFPSSNRGAGLVLGNFALGTAERIAANLAQEFLLAKFTRRGAHGK